MAQQAGFDLLFAQGFAQGEAYSMRTLDLVRQSTVIDMLGLLTLNYKKLSSWEREKRRWPPGVR